MLKNTFITNKYIGISGIYFLTFSDRFHVTLDPPVLSNIFYTYSLFFGEFSCIQSMYYIALLLSSLCNLINIYENIQHRYTAQQFNLYYLVLEIFISPFFLFISSPFFIFFPSPFFLFFPSSFFIFYPSPFFIFFPSRFFIFFSSLFLICFPSSFFIFFPSPFFIFFPSSFFIFFPSPFFIFFPSPFFIFFLSPLTFFLYFF